LSEDSGELTSVTLTDPDLVVRALGGSQAASREIVSRYQRPVFNLIIRMVRDRALAEDLAQETFLKAFARLTSYNPQFKFSNWLLKIAHNTVIDSLRQRRPPTLSLETPDLEKAGAALALIDQSAEDPVRNLERAELARMLERALARLRPEYRQVVVLRYHEDLGHDEIAEIIGVPVGTVKSYLHRARGELAGHLRGMLPAEVLDIFQG
jgi:RNA polymerase sigma-70 factor, ECF subfamily